MTKQEALRIVKKKIVKVKAIMKATTYDSPGAERYRETYLAELEEVREQLKRELE